MENYTIYDEELINDGTKVLTKKYKLIIALAITIMLGMAAYFLIKYGLPGGLRVVVVPLIGAVLLFILGVGRISSYKKALVQRLKVVNRQDSVKIKYTIDDEKIIAETPNGTNTLYHKDIKKIEETEEQYVIIYLGNVFIFVSKAGFLTGDENMFKGLIKK